MTAITMKTRYECKKCGYMITKPGSNEPCPNCGKPLENTKTYGSIETGYHYCSKECALLHTNKIYNGGKKNE